MRNLQDVSKGLSRHRKKETKVDLNVRRGHMKTQLLLSNFLITGKSKGKRFQGKV